MFRFLIFMFIFSVAQLSLGADSKIDYLDQFKNDPYTCFKLCRQFSNHRNPCYQNCVETARKIMGYSSEKDLEKNPDLIPYAGQFVGLKIEVPEGATDVSDLTDKSDVVVGIQQFPDEMIDDKFHVSVFGPPVTAKYSWEKENYLDWQYLDFEEKNGKNRKRQLNILNCHELEAISKMIESGQGTFHGQPYWGVGDDEFKKYFKSQCSEN